MQKSGVRESGLMRAPDGSAGGASIVRLEPRRDLKPLSAVTNAARRRRVAIPPWLAQSVLTRLPVAVAVMDASVRLVFWNEQAACLFGVPPLLAAENPTLADMLVMVPGLTHARREQILALGALAIAGGDQSVPDTCLRLSIDRDRRLAIQVHGLGGGRWMLVIDDGALTAASRAAPQAADAWLDSLTGLGNRRQFNQVLRDRLAAPTGETRATIMLIDLDRFALVNDRFGRAVGDALLCLVAQRLRRETRDEDLLVRVGDDEFLIVTKDGGGAELLADRVIAILSKPFLVQGHRIEIGASVGIARYPHHGQSTDQLLAQAGTARDMAKAKGRGVWHVCETGTPVRLKPRHAR